jgi:hypothetical protein
MVVRAGYKSRVKVCKRKYMISRAAWSAAMSGIGRHRIFPYRRRGRPSKVADPAMHEQVRDILMRPEHSQPSRKPAILGRGRQKDALVVRTGVDGGCDVR